MQQRRTSSVAKPNGSPEQGELPLASGANGGFQSRLERRLVEDPALLRRIADFATALSSQRDPNT